MRDVLLMLVLVLSLAPATLGAKLNTTEELIQTMQKKYGQTWYRTATFVQKTTDFKRDGTVEVSTWYEALSIPGSLRIDFAPAKSGNGILFTDGKIFNFKDGKMEGSRSFVHPLMILRFDIYKLPLAEVVTTLKGLKFDLSTIREDRWQGRAVYVVGAKQSDLHSPQFWIDKKNFYFVRMNRPAGKDGAQTSETQFNKYQKLGGGWMAPEVVFALDGKTITTEAFSEMRANVALDSELFDPQYWTTIHWHDQEC